jgi:hypothetical protein
MDCPQCGAGVPSDDLFCGKCGYAMRDHGPERLDQSRIRMHEEPERSTKSSAQRSLSHQRVRKHTVLGIPTVTPPEGSVAPVPEPSAPAPPTPIASARTGRAGGRTPQKTMLGIPRHEIPESPSATHSAGTNGPAPSASANEENTPTETAAPSHRVRARVRYDSADEPIPVTQRRRNALRALSVLVLLSAAWLAYRYLALHG